MNTLHKKNHTPATLARQWQCSERQIRNLVAAGRLRAFRIGVRLLRIPLDAVEEFEKCQATGSGGLESGSSSTSSTTPESDSTVIALTRLHQLRGLEDAKVLKSLGRSSKGRHYRG